jgi:general secretion pathway protein D
MPDGDRFPLVSSPFAGVLGPLIEQLRDDTGGDVSLSEGTDSEDVLAGAGALSRPTLAIAKLSTDGISFAAVIQAISTSSDSDLLSTPSILTLDNEEAKIVVGQNVPFRTGSFTTNNDGANNPFTTIQREDVGITLAVTPHIHDGEVVRLEVQQEVSSVVNAPVGQAAFSDIVTNKRTIETTILANDGETIVLGGLIRDDLSEQESRVPGLGRIPGIGVLFRSRTTTREKRNLMIFLRPTVLRTAEEADETTRRKYTGIWSLEGSMREGERDLDVEGSEVYDPLFDPAEFRD